MAYYNSSSALKGASSPAVTLGVEEVWNRCISYFEKVLDPKAVDTWFRPIKPVKLEGKTLTIRVPTLYFYEFLERNYSRVFSHILTEILGEEAKLGYEALVDSTSKDISKGGIKVVSQDIKGASLAYEASKPLPNVIHKSHLINNYTFDTFVTSDSNNVPKSFAQNICEHPGNPMINPFYVFGAPGVGKTHLINAIGHQLIRNNPSIRVLYVSTDTFVQQFTSAACNHKTADFTKFYRQVDVLLIDDIQSLVGKTKTQEAFFQIFNHLYMLGKQLVITCDKPPVELLGLEERLISRIAGSCIAHIDRPDENLRRTILDMKMEKEGIVLRNEVKEFIVKNVTSNLRELDGALTSLMLHSIVQKRDIDLKFAREIISRSVKMDVREITFDYILSLVCDMLGVTTDELRGKSRKQEIVIARQLIMYLAKTYTDESFATIGVLLGGRTHSTIVHGCNTIKEQMTVNSTIKQYVNKLEEQLGV